MVSLYTIRHQFSFIFVCRDKVVDFHWNAYDPWTLVSVSDDCDSNGGGGTLQVWHKNFPIFIIYLTCFWLDALKLIWADMAHEWFDLQTWRGGFGWVREIQISCVGMCFKVSNLGNKFLLAYILHSGWCILAVDCGINFIYICYGFFLVCH